MKYAIVLAAGKGTRMKSKINKVMHPIADKPLIGHLVDRLKKLNVDQIDVVVGYQQDQIREYLKDSVRYSEQLEQKGTGHALLHVDSLKDKKGKTIILYGDCPLVQTETIQMMFEEGEKADLVVLSAKLEDPGVYGRIVRNSLGEIIRIVEFKDANQEQRRISEINTGIYCVDNELLFKYLPQITNHNHSQEYYLTDIVELFTSNGHKVKAVRVDDIDEVMGINDRQQLAKADAWLKERINNHWMREGVTIVDPQNTYISEDCVIGQDTTIHPNVVIKGKTTIGTNTIITSNSWLENATIGDNTKIESSKIIDSRVDNNCTVGPFAHLRMNTHVMDDNRLGNFVEFKNTIFHKNSRCAHLTYLGDCEVGEDVNIGCGVVTVNYDGKNKYRTEIKDGAFVGSNCNLIAPIVIGKNAVIAAGSTISKNVLDNDMVIERADVITKKEGGLKYKNKKKLEGDNK